MEKNGQINYICYLCSKFYFSQFSEKWKDYIFILWYCRSLLLSSFSITSFFEIFIRKKTSVEKNYPKIDIKSTRTRCKICSKLTIKTPGLFVYCWLWTCTCLLGSYPYLYCLGDFHYLDHFHCLHDLQKNWNLVYILKLA